MQHLRLSKAKLWLMRARYDDYLRVVLLLLLLLLTVISKPRVSSIWCGAVC